VSSGGNSIKVKKVPNHLRKISNLVVATHRAFVVLRKSLRPIRHWKANGLQSPREPRCIDRVRRKVLYTSVKHVDSAYVEMAWNFFGSHLPPKYGPTQDLRFFW